MKTLLLIILLIPTYVLASPIYVIKQKDGSTKFTTKKPSGDVEAKVYSAENGSFSRYSSEEARFSLNPKFYHKKYKINQTKYDDIIEQASVKFGLKKNLIKAVIHTESSFNPYAISPKGAKGLMQLIPYNLKKYGVQNPFSPEQNIMAGSKMLSELLDNYSGNLVLALAAYNAGEGAVKKYKGVPPYQETQNYVRKVIKYSKVYANA